MSAVRPLVLLELNEVNCDFVRRYAARGELPAFARLLDQCGLAETVSESEYEKLEPWIQWVSAHTGLSFEQHRVFRLGDIVQRDLVQIWERLEANGIVVAAVSPINGANRTRRSPFFLPDPWTRTPVSGSWVLRQLSAGLAQAVGENAQRRMTPATFARLLLAMVTHFRASTAGELARCALSAPSRPWRATMFLDRFLADVFVRQWRRHRPGFASLFLNGAAHIQHHYMFSSAVYAGPHRNPEWYIPRSADPLLEIYSLYDRILADVLRLPGEPRVMLATGLHQDPHPVEQYYYRLRDHAAFLHRLAAPFASVQGLMSRDFTVQCHSAMDAGRCGVVLRGLRAPDGSPLFSVDDRGTDLFAMLIYPREIGRGFIFSRDGRPQWDLADDVAFVALKNGEHNGIGYFADTGAHPPPPGTRFAVTEIFARVCAALGVNEDMATGVSADRPQAA